MALPPRPVNPRRDPGPAPLPHRAAGWRAGLALAALLGAAPLGACSVFEAPEQIRGNRADAEMIQQLTPGVSTRADVTAVLGSPSATSTFDQREWYYISAVSHIRPARVPALEKQRVVVVRFDDRGVVEGIDQKGEDQMRNVAVVDRTTPVPGNERSLLQALFGNIGRFGPTAAQETVPGANAGAGAPPR
ncbi:outer membrane protein assembly factor BamE [Roseomonas nepalensis]|uniref:Outer membrane protein assembly factor BamE n=1 Tax=Muricoccus nepalensis TaxID=1854500 RepID=A0A502GCI2_9PROT|nr:outer membrane protein assembly factor BamE [Roseomonas nepalensis]TPG59799.1 outer membrane protein assembly factor BamE [Roseomonas nepalensis]